MTLPVPHVAGVLAPLSLLAIAALSGAAMLTFLRVFRRQLTSPGEGLHWANPVRFAVFVVGGSMVLALSGAVRVLPALAAGIGGVLAAGCLHPSLDHLNAWFSFRYRRPFRVGDRIRIQRWNLAGVVTRTGIRHTELAAFQGPGANLDFGGRTLLIPHALLRQECVVNDSRHQPPAFVLEEVSIRLSRDSDIVQAEQALQKAAESIAGDVARRTGMHPQIRAFPDPYGARLTLRVLLHADKERSTVRRLVRRIAFALTECAAVLPSLFWAHTHRAGIRSLRLSARAKRRFAEASQHDATTVQGDSS